MNPDLQKLMELEQVDREILRLQEEVAALPKRVAVIETKLAQIRAAIEKVKADIQGHEKQRRQLESDIGTQQQKIAKFREQSIDVKTNEQYKALMHEIQYAEQAIRTAEDKILEGMEAVEAEQKELKAVEAEAKSQAVEVEKEKADAHDRTAEDERLLTELQAKRKELRGGIGDPALAIYDRVSRGRKNPIAEARDQKCSACFVLLRPQKYNEIRSGDEMHTCDSCGRILFYNPAHEPPPAEPAGRSRSRKSAGDEAPNPDADPVADAPTAP